MYNDQRHNQQILMSGKYQHYTKYQQNTQIWHTSYWVKLSKYACWLHSKVTSMTKHTITYPRYNRLSETYLWQKKLLVPFTCDPLQLYYPGRQVHNLSQEFVITQPKGVGFFRFPSRVKIDRMEWIVRKTMRKICKYKYRYS